MPELLDVVALLKPYPELGLVAGQMGTVVDCYGNGDFEVEFLGKDGVTAALAAFPGSDLLKLRYDLGADEEAAA